MQTEYILLLLYFINHRPNNDWAINKCRVLKLDISAVRVVEQREMETAD